MLLKPGVGARPSGRLGRLAGGLDARVSLAVAVTAGVCVWQCGLAGAALLAVLSGLVLAQLGGFRSFSGGVGRAYLGFVGVWVVAKLGLDLWSGLAMNVALIQAGLLAVRLLGVLFVGYALALAASPRRLGLALAWYARPVLRSKAWQVALALALMVHFIPLVWQAALTVRTSVSLRLPRAGALMRIRLMAQTLVRGLAVMPWRQTMAVSVRGLDDPACWSLRGWPRVAEMLSGVVLIAGLASAARYL